MLTLALTGGIACGKSTVAGWLRELGAPIIDADRISRALTAPGGAALPAIREAFGEGVFAPDGTLNRAALGEVVFADVEKRKGLNGILHPMVASQMQQEADACRKQGAPIVILDVPLLYEAGMETMADKVACVSARQETQIMRLRLRDGLSREQALLRIHSQWPLAEKEARADFVIHTDRPSSDAYAQTVGIYRQLLKGAEDDTNSPQIPQ